jgi:hypothetical protein
VGAPISNLLPEKRKSFAAPSPAEARSAASAWLNDFSQHGPLALRSIRVDGDGDEFIAVVIYRDTRTEPSPRYFADKPPLAKSA